MIPKLKGLIRRVRRRWAARSGSAAYWNVHSVADMDFNDQKQSRDFIDWRNAQYPGYIDLMPVEGADGLTVLDYGCGPGHDLVGFAWKSRPKKLIGVDVSSRALEIARRRLAFEAVDAELFKIEENSPRIPLPDNSVDLIHSSGVLHHCTNLEEVLSELRRVLKPSGRMQVMVYNYNSIWVHQYIAFEVQLRSGKRKNESLEEAFRKSTDGQHCPLSVFYESEDFIKVAKANGFSGSLTGCAVSVWELVRLPMRFEAIRDINLNVEHRDFLSNLTFNENGWPIHNGDIAGINACYEFKK